MDEREYQPAVWKVYRDKLLCWEGKQAGAVLKGKLCEVRAMILPSLSENLPYAVLEAMAEGCPVIVSKSGGHAEIVEHGVSGYVFSHLEMGDMEAQIQTVLDLTPEATSG
jgi:glycosyltransferase involved in cell wall biosynthesis